MGGIANGFAQLFKQGSKRIGKAIDNFLLDAEARKAISDEVRSKFKPKIDLAREAENKRAANITELDKKLTESKDNWQKAQDKWRQNRDTELTAAKAQRQTDINTYKAELQRYKDAVNKAEADRNSILNQLQDSEKYDPNKTLYIDITTGKRYIIDPSTGGYKTPGTYYKGLSKQALEISMRGYETRLFDFNTGKVINPFDEAYQYLYKGKNNNFDSYLTMREGQNSTLIRNLRNADDQIKRANDDLKNWKTNNSQPQAWDNSTDLQPFKQNFESKYGSIPDEYSFNGKTYGSGSDLDTAYQQALKHEEALQKSASKIASKHISDQKAEIARRIQDAKDAKKAKLALGALGAGAGAGALYAGARAIYGGDDTDNTDNIDTTDNTYTGEPDPDFNVKNIPEGQAQLNDEQSDTAPINTGFDPDKADALAAAAYDKGVEDGNSVKANNDLGNNIGATTGGHTINDGLFELLKAMQDPYKANAVADYIYSRYGDDPDVQRLGWRGWLNKYYGDSLRSSMNIDPSGYNGMHISGGL